MARRKEIVVGAVTVPRQATLAECNREHRENVTRTKAEGLAARAAVEKITQQAIDSLNAEGSNNGR